MNDDIKPYETPEVVDSLDEVEVFGNAPASPTSYGGSGTTVHEV